LVKPEANAGDLARPPQAAMSSADGFTVSNGSGIDTATV
jgi:hypothetical protein